MDELFEPNKVLGTWKSWAQQLKSEINRLSDEVKDLSTHVSTRVAELYGRVENRQDAIRSLLTEQEARVRAEIAQLRGQLESYADKEALIRLGIKVDTNSDKATVDTLTNRVHGLEVDLVTLKVKAQMSGAIAGAVLGTAASLLIVLVEWWLGRK